MSIDLDAIRARVDAATPGPWRVVQEHGRDIADEGYSRIWIQAEAGEQHDIADLIDDDSANGSPLADENAEFIAHARQDITDLLAEVDQLRAELARAAVDEAPTWGPAMEALAAAAGYEAATR